MGATGRVVPIRGRSGTPRRNLRGVSDVDSGKAPPAPAGWYADPAMPGTQRYWDGERWSGHVAPAAQTQTPRPTSSGPSALVIALGVLIAISVVWVVYNVSTASQGIQCANDNADRVLNGQAAQDCP